MNTGAVRATMWSFAERLKRGGLTLTLNDAGRIYVEALAADALLPSVASR